MTFTFGKLNDSQTAAVSDLIMTYKKESLLNQPLDGINDDNITVDSPILFAYIKYV